MSNFKQSLRIEQSCSQDLSTSKQSLGIERSCSQDLSTFKYGLRESPGDPWSFFSWNNNTRINSSFVWTANFIPLEETHIAS